MAASASSPSLPSPAPPVPPAERPLSLGTRLAYGASAPADNLAINSINQLANAVFNITLGVPLLLVGLALSLPRLIDVFLDPSIGNWSDRLESRWGRRRPFILIGALLWQSGFSPPADPRCFIFGGYSAAARRCPSPTVF